jgi:hypothetical protein
MDGGLERPMAFIIIATRLTDRDGEEVRVLTTLWTSDGCPRSTAEMGSLIGDSPLLMFSRFFILLFLSSILVCTLGVFE